MLNSPVTSFLGPGLGVVEEALLDGVLRFIKLPPFGWFSFRSPSNTLLPQANRPELSLGFPRLVFIFSGNPKGDRRCISGFKVVATENTKQKGTGSRPTSRPGNVRQAFDTRHCGLVYGVDMVSARPRWEKCVSGEDSTTETRLIEQVGLASLLGIWPLSVVKI